MTSSAASARSRTASTASAWCPRASTRSSAPATRCSSRRGAGVGSGIPDAEYERVGARDRRDRRRGLGARRDDRQGEGAASRPSTRACSDGPDPLHLLPPRAACPELTQGAAGRARSPAIAYETIQLDDGSLPLLKPMSEVAGRMAIQVGAALPREGARRQGRPARRRARRAPRPRRHHRRRRGGHERGARSPSGMGAEVTILDVEPRAPAATWTTCSAAAWPPWSRTRDNIAARRARADLVVGARAHPRRARRPSS